MQAQESPKPTAPKLLTPEASLNLRSISDLQFSPMATAWRCGYGAREGRAPARHIWMYEKQSGSIRQFTIRKVRLLAALVARRQWLAFLSDRDEQQQSTPCARTAAKPAL